MGIWNKERILTLRTRVQSCQAIVQFAVESAQLIVQLRSERTSQTAREELKKQLQSLEEAIQKHVILTKTQRSEALKRKGELQEESEHEEEDDDDQRDGALKEVEEQSRLLETDQIFLGVVFSQVHSERTGQDISNVLTSNSSTAFVGLPENVVGKVHQRIRGVTTQGNSVAYVGVFDKSIDMRNITTERHN